MKLNKIKLCLIILLSFLFLVLSLFMIIKYCETAKTDKYVFVENIYTSLKNETKYGNEIPILNKEIATINRIKEEKRLREAMEEIENNRKKYEHLKNETLITASRGNCDRFGYMEVPNVDTSFKTYMSYKAITNTKSLQWKYRNMAYTDEQGFRRIDNDYVIALGSYYAQKAGERFEITLDSGKVFTAITGDLKADIHTDPTNRYIERNGNMIEFLVDVDKIDILSKRMGDMSYSGFEGKVLKIKKL